jgi:hypothetical protein
VNITSVRYGLKQGKGVIISLPGGVQHDKNTEKMTNLHLAEGLTTVYWGHFNTLLYKSAAEMDCMQVLCNITDG